MVRKWGKLVFHKESMPFSTIMPEWLILLHDVAPCIQPGVNRLLQPDWLENDTQHLGLPFLGIFVAFSPLNIVEEIDNIEA
jgi:hypothetical protein